MSPGKTRSPFGDIQDRMGLRPVEELLAERDELVKEVAPLRARHGAWGTYNDLRKIELAQVGALIRAEALKAGAKVTESFIEEQSHSSGRYADFVIQATEEKARWAELENKVESINDTIQRANAIARYLSQEIGLAR